MEQIRVWIGTLHRGFHLELLYRGSRDGFKNKTFHEKCDNKGPTVTVLETLDNKGARNIVGGYLDKSWNT